MLIPNGSKAYTPTIGRYPAFLPNIGSQIIGGQFVVYDDSKAGYIKDGFLANSTIYSIITAISKKFASIPLIVYEVKKDKKADFARFKSLKKDFNPGCLMQMEVLRAKSMDEVEGTALNKLLDNPSPNLSRSDMLEQLMGFRLLGGAGVLHSLKNEARDKILEFEVLPTQFVRIMPDGTLTGVKEYQLNLNAGKVQKYLPEDIMYWKYWNPDYDTIGTHLYGLSPIRAGLRDITANNAGKIAAAAMFQNGGAMGVLSPKDSDIQLTEPQAEILRDLVNSRMNGNENKGKITTAAIPLTWQSIGMSAVDMALIEANKLTKEDICNLFNYPPVLITNNQSTYNNVREAKKDFVSGLIVNECNSFTESLNRWLVPQFNKKDNKEYHIDFDISSVPEMQEDMKAMAEALDKMYYVQPNEKRALQKFDTMDDPNMDKCYFPANLIPLDQLNADMGGLPLDELDKAGVNDYR